MGGLLEKYQDLQKTKTSLDGWFEKASGQEGLNLSDRLKAARDAVRSAFPAEPFNVKISVVGRFRGGKSTLINALLGGEILPATYSPTTATITHVHYGPPPYRAIVHYKERGDFSPGLEKLRSHFIEAFKSGADVDAYELADTIFPPLAHSHDRRDQDLMLVLGAYGVVDGQGNITAQLLENELVSYWRQNKDLPAFPHDACIKDRLQEVTCDSLDVLEERIAAFTAFSDINGQSFDHRANSRLFLIDRVEVFGPFEMLATEGDLKLTVIDTPGLSDPREYVIEKVRNHLRDADCVAMNLDRYVFSEDDANVLFELYRGQVGQVQQLFVILGQADNFGGGRAAFPSHIQAQRANLKGLLQTAGIPGKARDEIAESTPIIPVSALAAVQRRWSPERVERLSPDLRMTYESIKARYPDRDSDGLNELTRTIRDRLDKRGRIVHLVTQASSGLLESVRMGKELLAVEVKTRRSTIEELAQALEQLEGELRAVASDVDRELKARRQQSASAWSVKASELLGQVNLATIALNQIGAVDAYVNNLAEKGAYWGHWKRLDAVRNRGNFLPGDYDSEFVMALEKAVMGGVLNATKARIQKFAEQARTAFSENIQLASEALSSLERQLVERPNQVIDPELSKALQRTVRARLEKSRREFDTVLERAMEDRFSTMTASFKDQAKQLVLGWSKRKISEGPGRTERLRLSLRTVIGEFLQGFPDQFGRDVHSSLTGIGELAGQLNLQVFDEVARAAVDFVEEQSEAIKKAQREKQQRNEAQSKQEEASLLQLQASLDGIEKRASAIAAGVLK